MATNITEANGTGFNTANMKPEPDEQIDSLWGQNIGDNLAALWTRDRLLASINFHLPNGASAARDMTGTLWFKKHGAFDTIFGTLQGESTHAGAEYFRISVNGAEVVAGTVLSGAVAAEPFSYDASGLTKNTEYPITYHYVGFADVDTGFFCNMWETI